MKFIHMMSVGKLFLESLAYRLSYLFLSAV